MPVTHYKIWNWGDAVGMGAMQSCHVGVSGIAKPASDAHPFALANEYICGALARVVRLPIPPGFVVEHDGQPYYVSLNFNLAGEDLPPADAARLAEQLPELTWGIILFDVWVANGDRHPRNLAYDADSNRAQIFDHSHAFMRGDNGRDRLEADEDGLGIGIREGRNVHCLSNEVTNLNGLAHWAARIAAVPDFYIREVVADAVELGLPEDTVGYCSEYLVRRRDRLEDLIGGHRGAFPKLTPDLWEVADEEGGAG